MQHVQKIVLIILFELLAESIVQRTMATDSKRKRHLFFGRGNAKLNRRTLHFGLPSGETCKAWAKECLSTADRVTGRITDGPHTCFRCWSASQESRNKHIRKQRWHNYETLKELKTSQAMAHTIIANMHPVTAKFIKDYECKPYTRINIAGEFWNETYFKAWLTTCREFPSLTFYAYTKALPLWNKHRSNIPENLTLNASYGGKFDYLIEKLNLPYAEVVFSEEEAKQKDLPIDHDDSHARDPEVTKFALLLHGTQPANSPASEALSQLKKTGWHGYGKSSEQYNKNKTDG